MKLRDFFTQGKNDDNIIEAANESPLEESEPKAKLNFTVPKISREFIKEKQFHFRMWGSLILFLIGVAIPAPDWAKLLISIVSALIIGYDVAAQGIASLTSKFTFGESLLVTLAVIGAFAIGKTVEGYLVMLFFQMGRKILSFIIYKSKNTIKKSVDMRSDTVTVLLDGEYATVLTSGIKVGDKIIVPPGERIALDGIVVDGTSKVDVYALTGEDVPQTVEKGSRVMAGSMNISGMLTVSVECEKVESTTYRIVESLEIPEDSKSATEKMLENFSNIYALAVVIAAIIVGVVVPMIGRLEFAEWIRRAFVLILAAAPGTIIVSVPMAYFSGTIRSGKKGIIIKRPEVIDSLAETSSVVFDKSGILAAGNYKIKEIEANGVTEYELMMLASYALAFSSHPIAKSVLSEYALKIDKNRVERHVEKSGKGVMIQLDGKVIVAGNASLVKDMGVSDPFFRTVSDAVYIMLGNRCVGRIVIENALNPDAVRTVDELGRIGIVDVSIITDDELVVAQESASLIGINKVYANCIQKDKAAHIEALVNTQAQNSKMMFVTGNEYDEDSLAIANTGVALGGFKSDEYVDSANVVVLNSDPEKVATAIESARKTRNIAYQSVGFVLVIKILLMVLGLAGKVPMWFVPIIDVAIALVAIFNATRAFSKTYWVSSYRKVSGMFSKKESALQ